MLQTFFVNPADFTRISLQLSICLSVYLQEEAEEVVVVVVMSLSAKGGLLFIASSIGVLIRWVPAASFCCKGFCFSCFCCYMSPNQSAVLMLGASPPSLPPPPMCYCCRLGFFAHSSFLLLQLWISSNVPQWVIECHSELWRSISFYSLLDLLVSSNSLQEFVVVVSAAAVVVC